MYHLPTPGLPVGIYQPLSSISTAVALSIGALESQPRIVHAIAQPHPPTGGWIVRCDQGVIGNLTKDSLNSHPVFNECKSEYFAVNVHVLVAIASDSVHCGVILPRPQAAVPRNASLLTSANATNRDFHGAIACPLPDPSALRNVELGNADTHFVITNRSTSSFVATFSPVSTSSFDESTSNNPVEAVQDINVAIDGRVLGVVKNVPGLAQSARHSADNNQPLLGFVFFHDGHAYVTESDSFLNSWQQPSAFASYHQDTDSLAEQESPHETSPTPVASYALETSEQAENSRASEPLVGTYGVNGADDWGVTASAELFKDSLPNSSS